MQELLSTCGGVLTLTLERLIRLLIIVLGAMGAVYIPVRFLEIKCNRRVRNITALVSMAAFSAAITFLYFPALSIGKSVWETVIFWLIASAVYILFGQYMYSRTDEFLDKYFGHDNEDKEIK